MKAWNEMHLGQEALGGLSAGIVGTVIGFPLDLVKTRMQTNTTTTTTKHTNILQVAQSVVRQEGIAGLYKGIGPPLVSLSILNTTTFTQYTLFREYYNANPGWDVRNYLAGLSCSPFSSLVSTVENLLKTQMQLDNITKKQYQSSFHCFRTLVTAHGPRIVYTGHMVNTLREAAFLGNYFFVYEGLRESLVRHTPYSLQVVIPISGGMSGALSWLLSFPLDCVRAGVQGQALPPTQGVVQVLQRLWRERGLRGLYAGASASVTRAFLVSGSRFSAYEGALWLLRGGRGYDKHHD